MPDEPSMQFVLEQDPGDSKAFRGKRLKLGGVGDYGYVVDEHNEVGELNLVYGDFGFVAG
jgi:hypothetical protein